MKTIVFCFRRWQPDIDKAAPKKRYSHRAMFDIQDSLSELRYYRENFFTEKK